MNERSENLYGFGEFCLDTREKILRRDDEILPLPPKVLDVLCLLVERRGGIVSKIEIMDAVWADSFVDESNLTQSIYTLRRVLGTDKNGKNFIENVPRRGYRIAAPIRLVEENEAQLQKQLEIQTDELEENSSVTPTPIAANETIEESKPVNITSAAFVSRYKYKKIVFGVGISLVALLLVGFAAAYFYSSKPAPVSPVENVVFQKLTFSGDVSFPVISPDGKSFAFVRDDNIFLQDIGTGSNFKLNVADHKTFGNLQFSLDGESIYFRNEKRSDTAGNIFQVSRFGGAAQMKAENVWSGPGFSPDGKQMAFARFYPNQGEWTLIIKNLESGEEKKLLSRNLPYSFYHSGYPAWSPDGRKIVLVEQTPQQKNISKLIIVEIENGNVETIDTPRFVRIEQTVWLSSGNGLLIVGGENNRFFQLWRMQYPGGELQRITNDLNTYRSLSLSADGKSLLAREYSIYSHIWTVSDNLENQKQITFGNLNRDGNAGIAWTPDGNLLYASRVTGNIDIWSVRPGDGVRRQLTENAGNNNENPVSTADGKYIFFGSTRSGTRHIWRMDANGENPSQMTFSETAADLYPAVSPDGKWLYYVQRNPKANVILRKSLTDGKTEPVTIQGKFSPETFLSLSPDGRFLAFKNLNEKAEEGSGGKITRIGVISVDQGSEPRFFDIETTLSKVFWTADGQAFDYFENTSEGAKLWRRNLDGQTAPKLLLNIPKAYIFDFAWSADGKNLALARGQQGNDVLLLKNFE